MESSALLGWIGSALFLARLVPQPLRLHRTGVSHGVSPLAALNAAASDAAWFLYGLSSGLAPLWVCTALAIPLDAWTLWLLRHRVTVHDGLAASTWVLIIGAAWALRGADGLGASLAFSVLVNHAPQVWSALRGDRLGGIAPATWYFALADAMLWGGYGLAVRDGALVAYGIVLTVSALITLARLWQVGGKRGLTPELPEGLPDPIENI